MRRLLNWHILVHCYLPLYWPTQATSRRIPRYLPKQKRFKVYPLLSGLSFEDQADRGIRLQRACH